MLENEVEKEVENEEIIEVEEPKKHFKGKHINKMFLIIPAVIILSFLVYNTLKTPRKMVVEETLTKKEEGQVKINPYAKSYHDIGEEEVKTEKKQKEKEQENIYLQEERAIEKSDKLKKMEEDAENAKRSAIGFQVAKNQRLEKLEKDETFIDYDDNRQGGKRKFLKTERANQFYLESSLTGRLSSYEIKAGDFLPAVLITALNSDLPARTITAQIRENIFDTVTGNYLLVPQGTKITGTYDSNVSFGQERLLVIWQRLIFPNGESYNLSNMQGVDLTGAAGLKGKVNNHFGTLMKGVLLSSLMGASAAIVTGGDDENDWKSEAGKGAGETIVKIGDKFAEKALNIQPTIELPQGARFNITVHSDMILKPYNQK